MKPVEAYKIYKIVWRYRTLLIFYIYIYIYISFNVYNSAGVKLVLMINIELKLHTVLEGYDKAVHPPLIQVSYYVSKVAFSYL